MASLVILPETRLDGDFDVEEVLRHIRPSATVKGAFISRVAGATGAEWAALVARLRAPPKLGRYLPFVDYPIVDYAVLIFSSARRLHPSVGMREGVRRVARDDFTTFANSVLGRVMMAAIGDIDSAIRATPAIFRLVTTGDPKVELQSIGNATYRFDFLQFFIPWEYAVGQFEGLVAYYKRLPKITVLATDRAHFALEVTYS